MKHFVLIYDFVDDYLSRRAEFRTDHLAKAWASAGKGDLVMAGALADPTDTGLLLFKGQTPNAAEAFARADPYVVNGLVKAWRVREWMTVAGDLAANPVKA